MVMVKFVGVEPLPNCTRQPEARWDAFLSVPDPDALAAEFATRGARFTVPLKDTHDGLRGFEIEDADGYVLFFGCPRVQVARADVVAATPEPDAPPNGGGIDPAAAGPASVR